MSKLETNTTSLQTILNTINNLPEAGGGSGGGSVETCTVTIQQFGWESYSERILFVSATTVENGEYSPFTQCASVNGEYFKNTTIHNVLCGSFITVFITLYGRLNPYIEVDGTLQLLSVEELQADTTAGYNSNDGWFVTLEAPTVAGENATMYFSYEP